MKRFLYAVLLLSSPVYADSVTSGALGLLIPSTGVIDTSRRWDDKYNGNFRMLASTINTLVANFNTLSSDTTTLKNRIDQLAIDTGTLATATGTLTARVNQLSIDTGTLATATATIRSILTQISIDTGTLATSTGALQSQFIVMNSTVMALRSSTNTLQTTLAQRTIVADNGGAPGSNITRFTFGSGLSGSQTGSTYTVTGTGGGGSGQRAYTLVVGTAGAIGVDSVAASESSFDLILASVGAMGLASFNSTVPATIGFRDGVYQIINGTVPSKIHYEGLGSSVVFVFKGATTQQILRVYGKMTNIKIDASGVAFRSALVQLSSNAVFGVPGSEMEIYNIGSHAGSVEDASALFVQRGATNVRVAAKIRDAIATGGVNYVGDTAAFLVVQATDVAATFPIWQEGDDSATSGTHIGIIRSTNVLIYDSYFKDWGAEGIGIHESHNVRVDRNVFDVTQGAGSHGIIAVAINAPNGISSSGIQITRNFFAVKGGAFTGNLIKIGGQSVGASVVRGNAAFSAAGVTFVEIGASSIRTILADNNCNGCATWLTDGGTETRNTGNDNFNSGTEQ